MKTQLARYGVERVTARADRIFFVYGMRRSGNHACIRWLANALEGRVAPLTESDLMDNFFISDSGSTIFINDITSKTGGLYLQFLHQYRKRLRRAMFIIISCEDRDGSYADLWRIPRRSELILVRRGALNLMASRFQNLNNRARVGRGLSLQTMGGKFFEALRANVMMPRGSIWEFERWCNDAAWRSQFLENLRLQHAIIPALSDEGGGSSFSGMHGQPAAEQLNKRFATVEPHAAWVAFIRKSALEHPDVFRADELEAIRNLVDD